MRKSFCIFAVLTSGVFLGGCLSLSNYQTAQVLDEGTSQFLGAVTVTSSKAKTPEGVRYYESEASYPATELMFRHAPARNFEFGVKTFGPFAGFLIDAKYQFINGETFDMAADLGVSRTTVEISSDSTKSRTDFLDLYPAILMTYSISESFSLTLAPKIIRRHITQTGSPDINETITGATLTLALGKKAKVFPEFGAYKAQNGKVDFVHYGIGFGFNF